MNIEQNSKYFCCGNITKLGITGQIMVLKFVFCMCFRNAVECS